MLCQNCNHRQSNVFIKRSINGQTKELHLCSDCAAKLGYSDIFNKPVFSGFGNLFENFFNAPSILSGESFFQLPEFENSMFGGYENKREPQIAYTVVDDEEEKKEDKSNLQMQLEKAVEEQNYEEAARIRDLINEEKNKKEEKDKKEE
ncbi:MAG: UvrB/UvrC motif-containing protein [Clostridia bacterium]|nr:UvrB/UvrC motif-containing protein [Clostridia bacterium]